jgi:hypothetical protein
MILSPVVERAIQDDLPFSLSAPFLSIPCLRAPDYRDVHHRSASHLNDRCGISVRERL